MIERETFICNCNSLEHQYSILYDKELNMIFIYPYLNKKSFLNRIKYSIMYIFGYRSKFGAFDEIIINPSDANKLIEYLKKIK